ncbi:hypothetical protein HMPREF0972_01905 [Actinomyces sp. oral taxon 848 str. F0332]|nr:hypothetical protein HMPREF0972_01905 [Actinomyces sp. oral taxon 848 str. F0332]
MFHVYHNDRRRARLIRLLFDARFAAEIREGERLCECPCRKRGKWRMR